MDEESKQAVVIDPGGDFPLIQEKLKSLGAEVCNIVHTHTHIDHVGATAPLQESSGAPARIHEEDRFLYEMLPVQAAMLGMPQPPTCEIHGDLFDDQAVVVGGLEVGVLHTPGHTPGSSSEDRNRDSKGQAPPPTRAGAWPGSMPPGSTA